MQNPMVHSNVPPRTFATIVATAMLSLAGLYGCTKQSHREQSHSDREQQNEIVVAVSGVEESTRQIIRARRLLEQGDRDAAKKIARQMMIKDSEDPATALLSAEIEFLEGNYESACELAGTIAFESSFRKEAVEIRVASLLKLNRDVEAIDEILAALKKMPDQLGWRHQVWPLLNRVGRRDAASQQAMFLCRQGLATKDELLSLVARVGPYPTGSTVAEEPSEHFESGLGLARWYFSLGDYDAAFQQLESHWPSGFQTAEERAFYGRLLSEKQSLELLPKWLAQCDRATKQHCDFWAALGNWFLQMQERQAAVHALLNAVYCDPTDQVSVQRLASTLDILGRPESARRFRARNDLLKATKDYAQYVTQDPSDTGSRNRLIAKLLKLGRPIEMLAWGLLVTPKTETAKCQELRTKLSALNSDQRALMMANILSLEDLDPNQFQINAALAKIQIESRDSDLPPQHRKQPVGQPNFVDVAAEAGLSFQWYPDIEFDLKVLPIHQSFGGGIGVLDFDLDGWPDVYFAQGSGDAKNRLGTRSNELFRNTNSHFQAVTDPSKTADFGYSSGIACGDVNQDGFIDLFLGSIGRNRLLINNGDGTFREANGLLPTHDDCFTASVAIADLNGDHLPDLFEANYLEIDDVLGASPVDEDGKPLMPSPLVFRAAPDRWFECLPSCDYRLHEIGSSITSPGSSLGVMISDFDSDGRNEIFVGNDIRPNHFLIPDAEHQFTNAAQAMGLANGFNGASNACMGIAAGDFDRNGQLDLHVTNYFGESVNLYLKQSGGAFVDVASRYSLHSPSVPMVGFGTKAIDIDRNGWLDLIVSNGHVFDLRRLGHGFEMPPQLMMSDGETFNLVANDDLSDYWKHRYLGRSVASLDFNRDGAVDFLVTHLDRPVALLKNESDVIGNWIQIQLVGTDSERDAIGARVVVESGNQSVTQWVTAGDGYYCSDQPVLDFGLGDSKQIDRVLVQWPSGRLQELTDLQFSTRYLIVEGQPVTPESASLWEISNSH